jgi:hypothetical protein
MPASASTPIRDQIKIPRAAHPGEIKWKSSECVRTIGGSDAVLSTEFRSATI